MSLKHLPKTLMICVLLIAGCQSSPNPPLPKITPTKAANINTPTAIQSTPILKPRLEPTNTLEPEDNLYFSDIPSGQYLLNQVGDGYGNYYLYVIATTGEIVKKIPLVDSNDDWNTSHAGNYLYIASSKQSPARYYNFSSQTWTNFTEGNLCDNANWSTNEKYITFACAHNAEHQYFFQDLYLFDQTTSSMLRIIDCDATSTDHDAYCFKPAWSFDGEWLAYRKSIIRSGYLSELDGVYLFYTKCFEDDSCAKRQFGPMYSDSTPIWSKKNELILSAAGKINFYEIKNGVPTLTRQIKTGRTEIRNLLLSPNEKYFVFTYDVEDYQTAIQLFFRATNTSKELMRLNQGSEKIGWIVIP